jgi:hypothetical protein
LELGEFQVLGAQTEDPSILRAAADPSLPLLHKFLRDTIKALTLISIEKAVMEFIGVESEVHHFRNTGTLIVPALSMGNAGQLAVDLLISHGARKAGYLDEPHVLPCVGNDPFGPSADGDLAVALEVYEDAEQNVSIVQQRAPVMKGTMMKFAKKFCLLGSS